MANDLQQMLLDRQVQRLNGQDTRNTLMQELYGQGQSVTPINIQGSNFVSGMNSALSNLISVAQAPDRRRQELIENQLKAEEVMTQRKQQDFDNMIALKNANSNEKQVTNQGLANSLARDKYKDALVEKQRKEQIGRNTIIQGRKFISELANLDEQYQSNLDLTNTLMSKGYGRYTENGAFELLNDSKIKNDIKSGKIKGTFEEFKIQKDKFNSLPDLTKQIMEIQNTFKNRRKDNLLNKDTLDDFNPLNYEQLASNHYQISPQDAAKYETARNNINDTFNSEYGVLNQDKTEDWLSESALIIQSLDSLDQLPDSFDKFVQSKPEDATEINSLYQNMDKIYENGEKLTDGLREKEYKYILGKTLKETYDVDNYFAPGRYDDDFVKERLRRNIAMFKKQKEYGLKRIKDEAIRDQKLQSIYAQEAAVKGKLKLLGILQPKIFSIPKSKEEKK